MKKESQLGMNPSTASNRLVKDILFKLAIDAGHTCFRCQGELTRETFSIEHKIAWLDSKDPVSLYFDLENIAFSHHGCNVGARRKTEAACGTTSKYTKGCRCSDCKAAHAAAYRAGYTPERRNKRYVRTGN